MRPRVHIAKDGRYFLPLQRVSSCNEGKRREDHLTLETGCARRNFQREGAITHGDAMSHACIFRDPLLELLDKRAAVGQPLPIEQVLHALEEAFLASDVWPTDIELLFKLRMATKHCQVTNVSLQRSCLPAATTEV